MARRRVSSVARRMQAMVVAIALVASMLVASPPGVLASSLDVPTQSGVVHGIYDAFFDVTQWRGIPYAAPPVGALRWRPPTPPTPWAGIRDATEFGSPCIQMDFEGGTFGSEDCLYLNVSTPPDADPADHLPVMVHLHPGGNFIGSGYEDASALVGHGVIVVTLNYRLGILGFAGAPALTAEGSLPEQGLLDQIAALRWVRDNIAGFGGNPLNVTLFGMSAGSFDTVALSASPVARGLFVRAAVETAAYWPATGVGNSLADKEQVGLEVGSDVGCGSASDVAACLRAVPAEELVLTLGPFDTGPLVGGTVLPRSAMAEYEANGTVPLLIGSNREEAFVDLPDPFTRADLARNTADLVSPRKSSAAVKLYPESQYDSLRWAQITMVTDGAYTCPTRRLAIAASARGTVYRYLFTHVMQNDPDQAQFRAFHTLEDSFLWHHFYPLVSGDPYVPTPAEEVLSAQMSQYWTNFAKSGDPNGPGLPSWPSYGAPTERYLDLDTPVRAHVAYHIAQCALLDTVQPFSVCTSVCNWFATAQWWHRLKPH